MDGLLVRNYTDSQCTLGSLFFTEAIYQALELPWNPEPGAICGRPDRSCIPAGTYRLEPHDSPAHPRTFALVNEALGIYHQQPEALPPGCSIVRSEVLLHVANYPRDLLGCIGVGLRRSKQPNGQWMITDSDTACAALRAELPWQSGHTLAIRYAPTIAP